MNSVLNVTLAQPTNARDRCRVLLSSDQLRHVCTLQDEANTAMSSENWLETTDDTLWYYRAIVGELAECADHVGIKWWKDEHPTPEILKSAKEQAQMEVIDVLHFAISAVLRAIHQGGFNYEEFISLADCAEYPDLETIGRFGEVPSYEELTVLDLIEQAQHITLSRGLLPLTYVYTLAEMLDLTSEDLYVAYVGKNLLNKFRTANGQREGTYLKIWDGVEDNEYLTSMLREGVAHNAKLSEAAILDALTVTYDSMINAGLATRG